jgi:hypothetical protein
MAGIGTGADEVVERDTECWCQSLEPGCVAVDQLSGGDRFGLGRDHVL